MALTKEMAKTADIKSLLDSDDFEDIEMLIDPGAVQHVIERLTDLYPTPIDSTVREVASNALDATLMLPEADRKPVEISTPTNLNPNFIVRDHGVGMSKETLQKVYSQYGASTKRKAMNQTGAYGLGAKAPLSYTNEYFLETTHEGITTVAAVRRLAVGNRTRILSVTETGKTSGTTITIPASVADVAAFKKALDVYRNFSFDSPFIVDGKLAEADKSYVLFDSITIEEDEQVEGRVWVEKNYMVDLFRSFAAPHFGAPAFSYLLSGWNYKEPVHASYRANLNMLVELKPGVVDFSSSRDSITSNERSRKVYNLVSKQVGKRDYLLKNMLAYFKTLSLAEAISFLRRLENTFTTRDGQLVYSQSVTVPLRIPFSEFLLADGGDPFAVLADVGKPNAYAAALFSREVGNYGAFQRSEGTNLLAAHATAYKMGGWKSPKVGDTNDFISRAAYSEPTLSIIDFLKTVPENTSFQSVVVVTEASTEVINKLLRARNAFAREMGSTLIFFTTLPTFTAQEVAALQEVTTFTVEQMTATEYLAKVATVRSKDAAAGRGTIDKDASFSMLKLSDGTVSLPDLLTNLVVHRRSTPNLQERTIEELKAEDAVILLVEANSTLAGRLLRGMANADIPVEGKPIYTFSPDALGKLKDVHLRQLLDYSLAGTLNWAYPSAAGRQLAADRKYDASMLRAEAAALPREDVIRGILTRGLWSTSLERVLTLLSFGGSEQVVAHTAIALDALKTSKRNLTIPPEFLSEVVDADLLRDLKLFAKLAEKLSSRQGLDSIEDAVMYSALNNSFQLKDSKKGYMGLLVKDTVAAYTKLAKKQEALQAELAKKQETPAETPEAS